MTGRFGSKPSLGRDDEVSAVSKLRGLCLCMRDASNEDMGELVTLAANTSGDDGPLDEEDELAEAAGEGEDDERKWLQETFGMYEMEGAGCITPLSLKLVLARLDARRDIAECHCARPSSAVSTWTATACSASTSSGP
jgi:calcium-binding protein CML